MTEISEKHLEKFQKIYKKAFGRSIDRKMAYSQAIKLLNFTKAIIDHAMKTNKSQEHETLEYNIDDI